MPTDLLDRLRAADISPIEADPQPCDESLARIQALRDARGSHAAPAHRTRSLRRVVPAGVLATGVLAATLVIVIASPNETALPKLGVLEAAAQTAKENPVAGRFSGYVQVQRTFTPPGKPAGLLESRTIVRRVSATEFDGTIETTWPVSTTPQPPVPQLAGTPAPDDGGARVTTRRVGDRITDRRTWRRPYGTIFNGALGRGQQPVAAPTDPDEARRAIASWATGKAPAGGDPEEASLLRDAFGSGDGAQLALGYATNVLTAPQVAPQVRAAVYEALAGVPGIRVNAHAIDPAGRPAASLTSENEHGTHSELFIDPDTALVLGTRNRYEATPDAGQARAAADSPTISRGDSSVFRYAD